MKSAIVESAAPVTLVAGGPVLAGELARALALAPCLVAADGGADRLLALGHEPGAVIGDLDSLSDTARAHLGGDSGGRIHRLAEQETTDFEKALRSVAAPFVLALGVTGGRIDHELAVCSALVRLRASAPPCIVIGRQDLVLALPPRAVTLRLRKGDRVSLFPMAPVSARSTGLRWPLEGVALSPMGMIGTSNAAAAPEVTIAPAGEGVLLILPRARLGAVLAALPALRG